MSPGSPPTVRVFISYTHDSEDHEAKVLKLSERLRADGIDCHLDQYELTPILGWPRWMVAQIQEATFVLVVCTEKYLRRFMGVEGGGAQWEGAVITQELYQANGENRKFIPVGFTAFSDNSCIPLVLRPWTYFNVSDVFGYENLYRHLTGQPAIVPGDIGNVKPMPPIHDQASSLTQLRPLDLTRDKPKIGGS
jgi:hypothetical protein